VCLKKDTRILLVPCPGRRGFLTEGTEGGVSHRKHRIAGKVNGEWLKGGCSG
jgi:hypothetical protein